MEDAKANFEQILEYVLLLGEPVQIMKDMGNAILDYEKIWRELHKS